MGFSEKNSLREKPPKPKARLVFGGPERPEYMLNIEGYGSEMHIPEALSANLQERLDQGWDVSNRGTRIEINCLDEYGRRDDRKILEIVEEVLGDSYDLSARF